MLQQEVTDKMFPLNCVHTLKTLWTSVHSIFLLAYNRLRQAKVTNVSAHEAAQCALGENKLEGILSQHIQNVDTNH